MKKNPRVLIDTFYQLKATTGIRTYTNEISQGLLSINGDISYQTFPKLSVLERLDLFRKNQRKWVRWTFHMAYFLWKQVFLPLICLVKRVDVLICPDYVCPALSIGYKKIAVIHSPFFWQHPENYSGLWLKYYTQMIMSGIGKKGTVVSTSEYTQSFLATELKLKNNIYTVYQSPKLSKPGKPSQTIDDLEGKEIILHVGYFDKRKNLITLVKAFNQYLRATSNKKAILVLAGGEAPNHANDFGNVKALIAKLGIGSSVYLPGHVSEGKLVYLYSKAKIYVFPSSNEGFGIPVMEAFHYHVPVIISRQKALLEVGGDAVLTFDTYDAKHLGQKIEELMSNESLRNELIEKGKNRLKAFSRIQFATDFDKVVRREFL